MRIAMMEMAIGIVLGKPVWFWGTQWAVIQNKLYTCIATRVFDYCYLTLRGTVACQTKHKVPANSLLFLHFGGLNYTFASLFLILSTVFILLICYYSKICSFNSYCLGLMTHFITLSLTIIILQNLSFKFR